MSRKEWFSLVILILVLLFAIYRYRNRHFTETKTRVMMGTLVELSLTSSHKNLSVIIDSTFNLIKEYEAKFSYYDQTSLLSEVNNSNGERVPIDRDFFEILQLAGKYYEKTGGRYDVTISPLTDLWGGGRTTIPPPDSIEVAMSLVGYDKIEYTEDYVKLPPGMRINLGSIAKGFIIDKAVDYALSKTVLYGHINAGGDIRLFGDASKVQRIGVAHPRERNRIIATLLLSDIAVVTSGDYERYFEYEGEIYHHIIDPLTGYPVSNMYSVTIIAPTATLADVLSTAVFLMEPEEGIELVKNTPGTEGIIYYVEGDDIVFLGTEGIKKFMVNN